MHFTANGQRSKNKIQQTGCNQEDFGKKIYHRHFFICLLHFAIAFLAGFFQPKNPQRCGCRSCAKRCNSFKSSKRSALVNALTSKTAYNTNTTDTRRRKDAKQDHQRRFDAGQSRKFLFPPLPAAVLSGDTNMPPLRQTHVKLA